MSPSTNKENTAPKANNETIKEAPGLTLGDNESAGRLSGENTHHLFRNNKKVKSPDARRRLDMGWSLLAEFNAQEVHDTQTQAQPQPSYQNYTVGLPVNGALSSSSNDGHKNRNFNNTHLNNHHHHSAANQNWTYYNNSHTPNMLPHHGPNPAAYNAGARDGYDGYYGAYGHTQTHHQYGSGEMYQNDNGNYNRHDNFHGKMHVPLTRMFGGGYHPVMHPTPTPKWGTVPTVQELGEENGGTVSPIPLRLSQVQKNQNWSTDGYTGNKINSGYTGNTHYGWNDPPSDEPVQLEKPLETKSQPVVGRLYHQQLYKRGMLVLEQLNSKIALPEFNTIPGRRVPPSVQDYMAMEAITNKLSANYDGTENTTEDTEEARNKNFLTPSPPTTPASELFQTSKPSSVDGSTTAGAEPSSNPPNTAPSSPIVPEIKALLTPIPSSPNVIKQRDQKQESIPTQDKSRGEGSSACGKGNFNNSRSKNSSKDEDGFLDCVSEGSCDEIVPGQIFGSGAGEWLRNRFGTGTGFM